MNTWRMNGSEARAVLPRDALLVGTVRQPSKPLAFFGHDVPQKSFRTRALRALRRQENHADAVFAG